MKEMSSVSESCNLRISNVKKKQLGANVRKDEISSAVQPCLGDEWWMVGWLDVTTSNKKTKNIER